jgi:hypothetical protein
MKNQTCFERLDRIASPRFKANGESDLLNQSVRAVLFIDFNAPKSILHVPKFMREAARGRLSPAPGRK